MLAFGRFIRDAPVSYEIAVPVSSSSWTQHKGRCLLLKVLGRRSLVSMPLTPWTSLEVVGGLLGKALVEEAGADTEPLALRFLQRIHGS